MLPSASCVFCALDEGRVVAANDHAFAVRDAFPVSPGHTLIIPRRHVADWWGATEDERRAVDALLRRCRVDLDAEFAADGYNIGINNGAAAGQTVLHLHVHLIPRYDGDVPDPRGGVRHALPGRGNYLAEDSPAEAAAVSALHDGPGRPLAAALADAIDAEGVRQADLLVSFVLVSGLLVIEPALERVLDAGGSVRLLTSDYLGVTEKAALERLLRRQQEYGDRFAVRVHRTQGRSFHPKSYLLGRTGDGYAVAFTGSANISRPGLVDGVEWTVETRDSGALHTMRASFEDLWTAPGAHRLDAVLIEGYQQAQRSPGADAVVVGPPTQPFQPTPVQAQALRALEQTRTDGHRAGLVVMATGLGKTWLAAFDSARPTYRRVLFVAHREEILQQARAVFRRVRPDATIGFIMGERHDAQADIVLATVQSLAGRLHRIDANRFHYVVVDEFHHVAARSYRQIVNHFDPQFMLGLTATPDRADGADLLALCDDNLVYDCGLAQGIERGLLVPFQYHGAPDPVDFAPLPWRNARFDPKALEHAVITDGRADAALREWERLRGSRTLAFCVSQRHADAMAARFRSAGVSAVAVHAGPASAPRQESLARLAAGALDVVFSVDMFNEGVDVPSIDTVLMLRPTTSSVVFLQQLGRGLRLAEGKSFLRVIDFVGNHRSFLLAARVLAGLREGRPALDDPLRDALTGSFELPAGCSVDYEAVAREDLLSLLPKARGHLLRTFVTQWTAEHGQRPTAGQAHALGFNPAAAPGDWFSFLSDTGVLPDREVQVVTTYRAALADVARTSMTKSYKMVALRAFATPERLVAGASVDDLATDARRLVLRDPQLVDDVTGKELADPASVSDHRWRAWWLKWPLEHLSGKVGFRLRDDRFEVVGGVRPDDAEVLSDLVQELVDWRMAAYLDRRRGADGAATLRVVTNGRQPILMLGRGQQQHSGLPHGRGVPVLADGVPHRFDFMKVAVNVARREDSDRNVLGDLLIGWFGPDAGQPGTAHLVRLTRSGSGWTAEPVRPADEVQHRQA